MAAKIERFNGQYDEALDSGNRAQHDLVLLGILAKGPMHGYDVRKEIDEKLAPLVGAKPRSIYYSLDRLEKMGLLKSHSARSGKRPKKFVYELTDKGRKEFKHLLLSNLLNFEKPCFNLDLSLFFFNHVEPESFEQGLKERLKALKKAAAQDIESILSKCGKHDAGCIEKITEHNRRMLREEIRFTRKLLSDIRERSANKKAAHADG